MSYVVVNAIEVPLERRGELESRFAARAGEVGKAPGFEGFQLLRPANDEAGDRYLVWTRWASKEAFEEWAHGPAFESGHRRAGAGGPVATGSQVWHYEVVQDETKGAGA